MFIFNKCSLISVSSIHRDINEEKFWKNCKNSMNDFNN